MSKLLNWARANILSRFRRRWRALRKRFDEVIEQQVVEMKGDPGKVSLGCALGLGINFIPTLGLGFAIAYSLAALTGANRICAIATSLLTGPLVPLKYAFNLLIGGVVYAHGTDTNLMDLIIRQYALMFKIGELKAKLFGFLEFFGTTFIIGSIINALLFGTLFYFGVHALLKKKFNGP